MFRPIQRGALADRIRRFFGVVGPYGAQIDEVVAPTAKVVDLTGQPWDLASQRWVTQHQRAASVVGSTNQFVVQNLSTGLAVIDTVYADLGTAVTSFSMFEVVGGLDAGAVNNPDAASRDRLTTKAGVTNASRLPIRPWYNALGPGPFTTEVIGQFPNAPLAYSVGVVIGPGQVWGLRATAPTTVAEPVFMSVRGRLFTDPALFVP